MTATNGHASAAVKSGTGSLPQDVDCTVLIVGGGVFGLSIAYSLAHGKYKHDPSQILVIDRSATPPEQDAACSDLNKIVRGDYCDGTYAALAQASIKKWQTDPDWQPYFHQSGIVVAASSLGRHGEHYVRASYKEQKGLFESGKSSTPPQLLQGATAFTGAMRATSLLSSARATATSSSLKTLSESLPELAYRNETSGWAWSRGAMEGLVRRCRKVGISFAVGQVDSLIIEDEDVKGARTRNGTEYRAREKTVLAAGSWSPAILPELQDSLTATGQILATIQLTQEEADVMRDIPVYIDMQTGFYMFPPDKDNVVKVSQHLRGYTNEQPSLSDTTKKVSVPRTGHFQGTLDENIPKKSVVALRNEVKRVWPVLGEKPFAGTRMCWYCDSKDCDFLVGYHGKYRSLFLATGDSGHAFKFVPSLGDLCTQAMEGTLTEHIAHAWSPTRERKDYKPDRGTSVLTPLDISQLACAEDLL